MSSTSDESHSVLQYSYKDFHFTDESDIIELSCSSSDSLCSESEQHICNKNCLNVKISEILHANFGMFTWPCAPVLGKYVWTQRENLFNKNILELGAGTALPSVVAAKCGAHVTITDSKKYDFVLQLGKCNMQQNKVNLDAFHVVELTWGKFSPYLINIGEIDVILGSDIFYDPSDFEDVLATVSYIIKRNPSAKFWCTYEHRCFDWNITHLLTKWNLMCKEVPLCSFGADKFSVAGSDLPGLKTISLLIMSHI